MIINKKEFPLCTHLSPEEVIEIKEQLPFFYHVLNAFITVIKLGDYQIAQGMPNTTIYLERHGKEYILTYKQGYNKELRCWQCNGA